MPFRTMTEPRKVIASNPGSKIEDIVALRLTDTGEEEFYIKGKTNIYEKTQTFKDDCDLEKILMRCTETGDLSLLNQKQPFYLDMEDMPENIFEMHQKIRQAEETFNNLPLNIKEAYGFSFDKFMADFGSDNWYKLMNKEEPALPAPEEKNMKGETETE